MKLVDTEKMGKIDNSQKKIAIIAVFFGKWPRGHKIFLESCGKNPSIDFFIFTDCKIFSHNYTNINFIPFTLDDFNKLATEKLSLDIRITKPYKICDFRPSFGFIFDKYISKYDFWGYSDLDMIYGDIKKFITDDILNTYDIISPIREFLLGGFSLYRNSDLINNLYKRSKDYKKIYLEPNTNFYLEECGVLQLQLLRGGKLDELKPTIDSMTHVIARSTDIRALYGDFMHKFWIGKNNWKLAWINGRLFELDEQKEVMGYNCINVKYFLKFYYHDNLKENSKFIIQKNGICVLTGQKKLSFFRHCIISRIHFIKKALNSLLFNTPIERKRLIRNVKHKIKNIYK